MRAGSVTFAIGFVVSGSLGATTRQEPANVRVVIRTGAGDFEVDVDTARAPVTASNFLRYVDAGSYADGAFYRVGRDDNQSGLTDADGVISMARAGPDTGTSEFFICVGVQPESDYGGQRNPDGQGFAAFGSVVRGMDVVRRIHGSPAEGPQLHPAVRILGDERADHGR